MPRNNEIQMYIDLGLFPNQHDFKEFTIKPKYCKRIKRVGVISSSYSIVSKSPEIELGLWLNNKKDHVGRYPLFLGKDPSDINNPKFIDINRELDCSKEISGFIRATQDLNNVNIHLLIILEK